MDVKAIGEAVRQICEEKGIAFEAVMETIESALAAAYRKDFGEKNQNVKAKFDLDSGKLSLFDVKTVVEDVPQEELEALAKEEEERELQRQARLAGRNGRTGDDKKLVPKPHEMPAEPGPNGAVEEKKRFNPKTDIQISEAQQHQPGVALGDEIITPLELPGDFGRMAAQTAKQVITQKLRETEREMLYGEYKGKEGEIIVGTVQRREGRLVLIDLGRLTALLPPEEQIEDESYFPGSRLKFFIVSVNSTAKGPEILVSRSHPEIVRKLFALEIPEVASGVVQIKAVAREAGSRSKVAVWTDEENIDPIGSCIGQRGARIQTIISELKGEKVDIIKWSDEPAEFIANAMSPAKVTAIETNVGTRTATAKVPENQLSLAIGKAGQNVRLAAKLSGWKIDVVGDNIPIEPVEPDATATEGSEVVGAKDDEPSSETEPAENAEQPPAKEEAETTTEEEK